MRKTTTQQSGLPRIKRWIKQHRHSSNPIVRFLVESLIDLAALFGTLQGILTNKQARSVFFLKLLHPRQVHQSTPATAMNRYPVIFSATRNYFAEKKDLRILSFGCSTGEEVLSLRYYFPDAIIVGAEINKYSLEICQKRKIDDRMLFTHSLSGELAKHGPYDAVFCMAVFQRNPQLISGKGITDISKIYPFAMFEKQICELDRLLKKGGLFVAHFAQYNFMDTAVASRYRTYGDYNQNDYGPYVFDKNGKLITSGTERHSIFIKITE